MIIAKINPNVLYDTSINLILRETIIQNTVYFVDQFVCVGTMVEPYEAYFYNFINSKVGFEKFSSDLIHTYSFLR